MVCYWLIDSNSSALSSQHPQTLRIFPREAKNIKHDRYFPQGLERSNPHENYPHTRATCWANRLAAVSSASCSPACAAGLSCRRKGGPPPESLHFWMSRTPPVTTSLATTFWVIWSTFNHLYLKISFHYLFYFKYWKIAQAQRCRIASGVSRP